MISLGYHSIFVYDNNDHEAKHKQPYSLIYEFEYSEIAPPLCSIIYLQTKYGVLQVWSL